jgi:carbon-monoxide dehydrogenase medium subunit
MTKRLKEFRYSSPATVEEALSVLTKHNGEVRVLAGGTDLLSIMKLGMISPDAICSLSKIPGLDYIRQEGQTIRIGALTKIITILESDVVKQQLLSLHETTAVFATPQIRNMATIGGNICRSSPCANTPPPLMTFDAQVRLVGTKGERIVSLEDFSTGAGENVLNREILKEIVIPLPEKHSGTAFMQLTRNSSDLAKANCAVKCQNYSWFRRR